MGTEAGLPSCFVTAPEDVLPDHVRPPKLDVEAEVDEGCGELALHCKAQNEEHASILMPHALHIPGVCHAIHNGSADLDSSFSCWDSFLENLKCLHKFLGSRARRDRFLEVLLAGSPEYDRGRSLLGHFSHSLHTARWGEVAQYLDDAFLFSFLCATAPMKSCTAGVRILVHHLKMALRLGL